ncbi:Arg-Lys translocation region protein phosphatase RktP [Leptospira idonii]|uniref:Arg-Lys translocation region protein phosphatase n=1 Tax=Leptospira idonii TaxID=1193500 RepID=A0A4R9LY58_9LEPT|nr:Arg-Lys translocation region protein phosphatase RktP [Leptospira idonii]TGN19243.1 Arg-Lys translocation region protein phosphatase [Leptospira idonii]
MKRVSIRKKIPFLIGLFCFILFLAQFLLAEFAFTHWQNPAGNNVLNFKMLGLYLSLAFSVATAFFTYHLLGFIYKMFLRAASEIQHVDLGSDTDDEESSEEASLLRSIKLALFQAEESVSGVNFENQFDWELSKAVSLNRMVPDLELKKIQGWDISAFPSIMRHANSDYMRIIKTKDGFVGILAGHMEPGVTESAERLFIHGIISAYANTEEPSFDILDKIESSFHKLSLQGLKLSLFGIGSEKDKLKFLHFMDMPVFQFSNQGIQVIEGSGDDSWHALHEHEFSMADGIEIGDYLVWGSDRTLKEFGLTSFEIMEEFVDYLLDLSPNSSREMLLAIAKKMEKMGKERNLTNPLEKLSIFVLRRTK